MPQLRDSGNSPLHAGSGAAGAAGAAGASARARAATRAELASFDRIFGVETEYGVSLTGAERAVDAGHVAMAMFRPVVSRARSTNTYLENGSRLYLDVGSHPEYATAEARDPLDALAQDLAGERVMASLALRAQESLRESHGPAASIHVYKNNVDSAGHAFGCHENYLVRRFVPLETVERQLLPFLITRQLYTGAGRVGAEGFQITQRADFLDEAVSSATTRSRPMVNTRDEPHADPESFRRLHVIIGDSNRSQWATWMKLATTHLVLCVIEDAVRRGVPSGFESCALGDPAAANRAVSRWWDVPSPDGASDGAPSGSAAFDGASDGMRAAAWSGMDPLTMQRRYLDVVEAFVRERPQVEASLPRTSVRRVLDDWRWALDALAGRDVAALAPRVDWAAKRVLFDALLRRRPDTPVARLEQVELDYHDVANGGAYAALVAHGRMERLMDDGEAERAMRTPPSDTRAALRGAFVARALACGAQFSCDWTTLTVPAPVRREATLLDPFASEPDAGYEALMAVL